jgi:hypothetical protein
MYLLAYTRSGQLLLVFSMKYHTENAIGGVRSGGGQYVHDYRKVYEEHLRVSMHGWCTVVLCVFLVPPING